MFAYRRTAVHRRVIVNLVTGTAFSGVLLAQRGPLLILAGAELLKANGDTVPVDGEVVLERARVEYVQVLAVGAD